MPRRSRRMGDIYVGEEGGATARRSVKLDPDLTIANAHTHKCTACERKWYCWCWNGTPDPAEDRPCLACHYETSLPKVRREKGDGWGGVYRTSKLFSCIEVSQGGWASRWVTTRELRAARSRWIDQEYKASPPEVAEEGGSYQCGGCRFFLALDSDYGICANVASPYDGRITFEHIGCKANPYYVANHPEEEGHAQEQ